MYEVFERLLAVNGKTVSDVVKGTGINYSTLSNWKRRNNKLSAKNAQKIADFFGVSIDYLMTGEQKDPQDVYVSIDDVVEVNEEGVRNRMEQYNSRLKHRLIPVFGRVAAGIPLSAIQEILDWEELDDSYHGEFFGLKVVGDSMSPRIEEGDTLIVKSQPDAESGDIVIAQINGDQATVKKLIKHQNGISLVPLNLNYSVLYFSAEEVESLPVRIIGKVVENRQKF